MILKKIVSLLTAAAVIGTLPAVLPDIEAEAAAPAATKYSYKITPMMAPFNSYFYVKTDYPDPMNIRFVDKSTVYSEEGNPGILDINYDSWDREMILYSDVDYEDKATGRVKGGYIFASGSTDGGEVTLQYKKEIDYSEYCMLEEAGDPNIGEITEILGSSGSGGVSWQSYRIVGYYKWVDTSIKITLPKLKTDLDYLTDTYATKSDFFENMGAVQEGLSSICLYSGSWIRGEVYRSSENWAMSNSPHKDQSFYIQSPYSRRDNQYLFASSLYPYCLDSIGFPSVMASVAEKLDPNCTIEWDSYSHAHINVTHNGTTKSYGGQGIGNGKGLTEYKITRRFTFAESDPSVTLSEIKSLLTGYSEIEMDDDIPHYDDLTWEQIWNAVGSGKWVRMISITSIFGGTSECFAFLYQRNDGDYFYTDNSGVGGSIYWGGDIGYASDCWVDGRYVNSNEAFVPGEKFEDHPTSDIIIRDFNFPEVSYKTNYDYDYDEQRWIVTYSDVKVKNVTKTVRFCYDSEDKVWRPNYDAFPEYSYFSDYKELVDQGLLAKKYLNAIELTEAEVKAMKVDANTDLIPKQGIMYVRSAAPGTPFNYVVGDVNMDSKINMKDVAYFQRYLNGDENFSFMDMELGDTFKDGSVNMKDLARLQRNINGWNEPMG